MRAANACHWCPLGSFTDGVGQTECVSCPLHQSTRKIGAKSMDECAGERSIHSTRVPSLKQNWNLISTSVFSPMSARDDSSFEIPSKSKGAKQFDAILPKMLARPIPIAVRSIEVLTLSSAAYIAEGRCFQ